MTTEQIINIVIEIVPNAVTILTVIGIVWRVLKYFKDIVEDFLDLKKQVVDMKHIQELKDQMGLVIQENYELKKKLNETMTKIDHIERK